MSDENSKLVYSTGKVIPGPGKCGKEKPSVKTAPAGRRPVQPAVTVRIDRKSRGGKSVTLVEGLDIPLHEKEDLLRQLKGRLGAGGTMKGSSLEIQGDHRDVVMSALEKRGLRPKRSGG